MKTELQRYYMEVETDHYSLTPHHYIKEYKDEAGDWVYAHDAVELEKQNEKMLDALNKLLHVAKNAVPMKFMEELDEVVRHCQDVVNQIEGEHE